MLLLSVSDSMVTLGCPTASSYAARRLRLRSLILEHLDRVGTAAFSPVSRVSISELLGIRSAMLSLPSMLAD